jgi:hypothetical protein
MLSQNISPPINPQPRSGVPIDRELVKNEYVSDNVSFQFSVRGLMCAWTNVRIVVAPIRETTSQTMAALLLHLSPDRSPFFTTARKGAGIIPSRAWSSHASPSIWPRSNVLSKTKASSPYTTFIASGTVRSCKRTLHSQ